MIVQLLKDPNIQMTDEFLAVVLGDSFAAWKLFNESLPNYGITLEWRYYKDGGWLAKCTHKKNTIIWSSVSEGYFSASFLFSEKPHLRAGIQELDISDDIKNNLISSPGGKWFSVAIDVRDENQLPDVYKMIEYKKTAK
ncbi:MAG: DUF3788 domain-containing protein [Defluviitaleaceae bacterium]|nr:DUF3788 domain-containing protein [Defluviitaleaceae bacterium]